VPHYGLVIGDEEKFLFKSKSISQREKQTIAFLIAKQFSEFVI